MKGNGQYIGAIVFGAVFAGIGGAVAVFAGGFGVVFGGIFAVVGLAIMANGIRHLVARSAFEQVHLAAVGPVALGGTAELHLVLTPKRALRLTGDSKVKVTTTEKAYYSAGTSSRTYTNVLFTREQPLNLPQLLSQHVEQRIAVPIPADIPPTWSGKSNWFYTTVEVRVDVDNWPDLVLEAQVEVLPEVA